MLRKLRASKVAKAGDSKEEVDVRGDIELGVMLDDKSQRELNTRKSIAREASLAVDRNHWFWAFIIMSVFAMGCLYYANVANERFANNVQVAYVKMYPNGTWDIEFYDSEKSQDYFPTTIDALITQFVERRYSKQSHSIGGDYGFASLFMGKDMLREFLDPAQFNAAQVAADQQGCEGSCKQIKVKVRNINHYDSEMTMFGPVEGALYRTNVFVEEVHKNPDGSAGSRKKKIVPLQWRIRSKKEISSNKEALVANPIGLEIIDYDLLNDGSESVLSSN